MRVTAVVVVPVAVAAAAAAENMVAAVTSVVVMVVVGVVVVLAVAVASPVASFPVALNRDEWRRHARHALGFPLPAGAPAVTATVAVTLSPGGVPGRCLAPRPEGELLRVLMLVPLPLLVRSVPMLVSLQLLPLPLGG